MHRRTATEEIIREVLQEDYIELEVKKYVIKEVMDASLCSVSVEMKPLVSGAKAATVLGEGVGFVDALYSGLVNHYAAEYPSLSTITFTGFEIDANMGSSRRQGADAECAVTLVVRNTEEREFRFEDKGRSLVAASFRVVVEAAQYFINSERAYISVYRALCDARERSRPDLIERYTGRLAQLVTTTSYSEVIERIKNENQ